MAQFNLRDSDLIRKKISGGPDIENLGFGYRIEKK